MPENLFSSDHIALVGTIIIPLGSAIGYVIWRQAQMALKVDVMFQWFINDGHEITGGDKYAHLAKRSDK